MKKHLTDRQLSELAEGLMPPDQQAVAKAHLASCPRCREALADRQALIERLRRGLPAYLEQVPLPPTLRWDAARHQVLKATSPRSESLRRNAMWKGMRAAVGSFIALALLLGMVLVLSAIFRPMSAPLAPGEEGAPPGPVVEMTGALPSDAGLFGPRPVTLTVQATLPTVPERLPLYRVELALHEIAPETIHRWADRLGMGPVQIYRGDLPMAGPNSLIGLDEGWRSLTLNTEGALVFQRRGFRSSEMMGLVAPPQEMVGESEARAAATAFIRPLVPYLATVEGVDSPPSVGFSLTLREEPSPADTGVWAYQVEITLDGVPLASEAPGNMVLVGADGEVTAAFLTPVRLTPTGEQVTLRPLQETLQAFLQGDASLLRGSRWGETPPSDATPRFFQRPLSFQEGDRIAVNGWVQRLSGVEGAPDLLLLHTVTSVGTFVLEGVDPTLSSESGPVRVEGTVGRTNVPDLWRLRVERVMPMSPEDKGSWDGVVEWREDGLWLKTLEGQQFRLLDPPEELPDGARVSVMGMPALDDPQRLEWGLLVLLPEEEPPPERVAQVVMPPPPPPPLPTPASLPTATVTETIEGPAAGAPVSPTAPPAPIPVPAQASEVVVVPAVPLAQGAPSPEPPSWWEHQPGDEVTVVGLLSVNGFREPDGTLHAWANLIVEGPTEDAPNLFLSLAGEDLEALAPWDGLHVRVRGQILTEEEAAEKLGEPVPSPFGQVLWVEEAEPAWPEETKDVYSGSLRIESVEGREVALLDDELTGQTFALAGGEGDLDLYRRYARLEEPIAIIGIRVPQEQVGGYPVLRMVRLSTGEGAVEDLRRQLTDPFGPPIPAPSGPTEVVIEEVKLAYTVQGLHQGPPAERGRETGITEPLYLLIGHSPDGRYQVAIRLQATEEAIPSEPPSVFFLTPTTVPGP
ncbi:MAG: hypothetical protein D6759_02780 [Chloroflexi bacterium]|nr:MAG: hypothetical protein D6759_02780 [Chloroflexota bacterium]